MKKAWKPLAIDVKFGAKQENWGSVEDAPANINALRLSLPTETNATRKTVELNNISEAGPFFLNFSNIPYDSTDEDLIEFLQGCEISRILRNERRKGVGFIEFKDFKSLNTGLTFDEKYFKSRIIQLRVASSEDVEKMMGGHFRRNENNQGYAAAAAAGAAGGKPSSADDDDWRAKKPASKPQFQTAGNDQRDTNSFRRRGPISGNTSTETAPSDSSNWRQRVVRSNSSDKPQEDIYESDNWRRAPPSSSQSHSKPTIRTHNQELSFGRKPPPSNFTDSGDKDIDIERKFEKMKIQNTEGASKTETKNYPRPSVWGNRKLSKPTNDQKESLSPTESNSDALEWRTGAKPPINTRDRDKASTKPREKVDSSPLHQLMMPAEEKKKPEPAPVPSINVWEERKKSKMMNSSKLKSHSSEAANKTPVIMNSQQPYSKCFDNNNSAASNKNNIIKPVTEPTDTCTTSISGESSTSHGSATVSAISKPPVIISAKGPFLDPTSQKSQQMQQYVTDNTHKLPKVVPITKPNSDINQPTGQASAMPPPKDSKYSATPLSKTNPKSSWAKGPPKNLVEKSETNQNVIIK